MPKKSDEIGGRASRATGREYLLEFQRQGAYVRVAALDPLTGAEAVMVGDAKASKDELSRLAVQKLKYLIQRREQQESGAAAPEAPRKPRGTTA